METVNFTKAVILARGGIRSHLDGHIKEEENHKDAIMRFTRKPKSWINVVTPENLVFLQYLYIVWKDGGTEIFSKEEYEKVFYSCDFEQYVLRNSDYSFKKLLFEDNEQNREQFFMDIVLEKIQF